MQVRIGVAAAPAMVGVFPVHAVNRVYVAATRRAGALPFMIPTLDPSDAPAVLEELDGLVLSGGGDLDPATYGGVAGPDLYGVDGDRDRWELALAMTAEEMGIPVLGICRGLQTLNVAAGGTLVGHLPDLTDQAHRVTERDCEPVHTVAVADGSTLHRLTGPLCAVNSLHHQAADRVGPSLRVVGRAPDGVIEAIEGVGGRTLLGVQWHPELLVGRPEQQAVWSWLVASAETWRNRHHGAGLPAGSPGGSGSAATPGSLACVASDPPPSDLRLSDVVTPLLEVGRREDLPSAADQAA